MNPNLPHFQVPSIQMLSKINAINLETYALSMLLAQLSHKIQVLTQNLYSRQRDILSFHLTSKLETECIIIIYILNAADTYCVSQLGILAVASFTIFTRVACRQNEQVKNERI